MERVCFVGASIVEGMGDTEGLGWAGRLLRGRGMSCYNLGIRSQKLAEIRLRAAAECFVRLPKDCVGGIVFSSGVNDLAILEDGTRRTAISDTLVNFERLLSEMMAIAPVIVVGPGPVDEARMPLPSGARQVNAVIAEADVSYEKISCDAGVEYISVHANLLQSDSYMNGLATGDGLHPDAAGHQAQADLLKQNKAMQAFLNGEL